MAADPEVPQRAAEVGEAFAWTYPLLSAAGAFLVLGALFLAFIYPLTTTNGGTVSGNKKLGALGVSICGAAMLLRPELIWRLVDAAQGVVAVIVDTFTSLVS